MTNYEAIKNLTPNHLEKLLDQVFLTGFNTGYQSLVDPGISDDNPFNAAWLNSETEGSHTLVENEAGEDIIIIPFLKVVKRIIKFNISTIPEDINWQSQLVLPKGMEKNEE